MSKTSSLPEHTLPLSDTRPTPRESWRASLRGAIRTLDELLEALELDSAAVEGLQPGEGEFSLLVPRAFVDRMRKRDPRDPLLRQILPQRRERVAPPGFELDPLRERDVARHGVLQKYAGRALLVATAACPVHCRYCFRRHFPYSAQLAARRRWGPALSELRRMRDVREVILSGGDPLSLDNERLKDLVAELEELPGVDTLRIHTRFPIVLPDRVDAGLLRLLSETALTTVVVVHCNHANEVDDAVRAALREMADTGTQVLNQSVLLRGVNDNADALEALCRTLFDCGALPYYLHLLDPVQGAAHFDVDEAQGRRLIGELRLRLPGYLVPRLVREQPGELSKTIVA